MHVNITTPLVAAAGPLAIKRKIAHASNYRANPTRTVGLIVIHATAGHEGFKQDDNVAAMFARNDLKPKRSCHYVIDSDSVTQCVDDHDIAWHCGKKGNALGLGIELCGSADQTREQWYDALSKPMLAIAARLVATKLAQYALPARFVDPPGLRVGLTGITTHAAIAQAWGQTNHYDPGKHFPLADFVEAVRVAMGGGVGV